MRAMALVSVVVCALVASAPSQAASAASMQNVRPRDEIAELLLRFGGERSERFRQIVRELEGSNVVVYIDVREDGRRPVGGGLNFVSQGQGVRWVRAFVDSGTANRSRTYQDIVRLTAILAHELRHALEASQAPTLSDVDEFERYFRQIGVVDGSDRLDTRAARETGAWVEDELRGVAPRMVRRRET
jgi:hypothetical protein